MLYFYNQTQTPIQGLTRAAKCLAILGLVLIGTACSTTYMGSSHTASSRAPYTDTMNDLAMYAMGLVDTPYKYGGNSPDDGLDCSGFVVHVFGKVTNKRLPRTSAQISRVGLKVDKRDLRPGDLVFFNTLNAPNSHVGIYVGEGRFVHAPGSGKAIALAVMDQKYWRTRYEGARRIARD